jgi:type IV pilus assembly protein PilM
MPRSGKRPERNPIVGISFGNDQIRVVEVRRAGTEYTVTAAGSVPIPAGAFDPGSTVSPDTIAQRLKNALKKVGATTNNVVMGVPSTGVFTRLLDIPQIPDEELEPVVAGEVAHYQMIRPDGGAFGFARLPTPEASRDIQVLVMAADDPILHSLDETARKAGLNLIAKEPSQLGAIRTGYQTNFAEPTLMIAIDDAATEIAVVDGNKLMLYRRIDVGGRNLLANTVALAGVGAGSDSMSRKSAQISVDEVLSARMATEIRRSMDYFRRQFPQSDVGHAIVSSMDSRLDSMAEYLEGALGIQCRVAVANVRASGAAAAELGTPISNEYFSAIGLAMGQLGYADGVLPTIDLVPSTPRRDTTLGVSGGAIASIVATAAILVIGFFAYTSLKSDTASAQDRSTALRKQQQILRDQLMPIQQRYDMEVKLLSDLSRQGTPFPWVMDAVTQALDPGVGVSEMHIDGTHVRLTGEAKDEASMVNTLDHIRTQGSFTSPYVDSFQNQNGAGLDFNLSSDFVVAPPPPPLATVPTNTPASNTATPGGVQ